MRAALFVTCLIALVRRSVSFAALRLLEAAGRDLVPPAGPIFHERYQTRKKHSP